MKRIIQLLMIGYISIIGGLNCASAQRSQASLILKDAGFLKEDPPAATSKKETGDGISEPLAVVNKKALNDFRKNYKEATNETWWRTKEDGLMAKFLKGDIKTRVYYRKNGKWVATIIDYNEENLPKNIRNLVRKTYYDFSIFHVAEVTIDTQTVYLITLQDETSWKKIRVIDGEIIEDTTYIKK